MVIRRIAGERVYFESVVFAGAVVIGSPVARFFAGSLGLLQPAAAPAKHEANTAHSTLVFKFMTVPLPMRQPQLGGNPNSKTAWNRSQVARDATPSKYDAAVAPPDLSRFSPVSSARDAQLARPEQPIQTLGPFPRSFHFRACPCL